MPDMKRLPTAARAGAQQLLLAQAADDPAGPIKPAKLRNNAMINAML